MNEERNELNSPSGSRRAPKRGDKAGDMKVTGLQGDYVQYVIGKKSHSVHVSVWRHFYNHQ